MEKQNPKNTKPKEYNQDLAESTRNCGLSSFNFYFSVQNIKGNRINTKYWEEEEKRKER